MRRNRLLPRLLREDIDNLEASFEAGEGEEGGEGDVGATGDEDTDAHTVIDALEGRSSAMGRMSELMQKLFEEVHLPTTLTAATLTASAVAASAVATSAVAASAVATSAAAFAAAAARRERAVCGAAEGGRDPWILLPVQEQHRAAHLLWARASASVEVRVCGCK